jgi:hypothetical protein
MSIPRPTMPPRLVQSRVSVLDLASVELTKVLLSYGRFPSGHISAHPHVGDHCSTFPRPDEPSALQLFSLCTEPEFP